MAPVTLKAPSRPRTQGVHMGPDDSIYLTDDGGHFVRKCSLDGKVLRELGLPGKPAPYMSGEPFHRCTHTALSPKGEIYVSDGYGNARVHCDPVADRNAQVRWLPDHTLRRGASGHALQPKVHVERGADQSVTVGLKWGAVAVSQSIAAQ